MSNPLSHWHIILVIFLSSFIALVIWRIVGSVIKEYCYQHYTVTKELSNIGTARPDNERIAGTAVICGGSVAGLWAARICADHFEDVVIVEPEPWLATEDGMKPVYDDKGDRLEPTPQHPRTRLYQYNAAHIFWNLTLTALRRLFPSFDEKLLERDGRVGEANWLTTSCAGRFFRAPRCLYSDGRTPEMLFCSRDAFERLLRNLVINSSSRIRQVVGTVAGLNFYENNSAKIKSATLFTASSSEGPAGTYSEIPAELVVDCTGGTQAGLKWIKKMHAKTTGTSLAIDDLNTWNSLVESYDINSHWRTHDFFVPPELRAKLPIPGGYENCTWLFSFFPFLGDENKYFVIYRVEGHRIRFTFYGWGNPDLPDSSESIGEYMATVKVVEPLPQWIFDMLDQLLKAKEEETAFNGKAAKLNWIHYENAPFVPSNFVAIGDAVMKVNPAFGDVRKPAWARLSSMAFFDGLNMFEEEILYKDLVPGFLKPIARRLLTLGTGRSLWVGNYMFPTTTPGEGEQLSDEKLKGRFALFLLELSIEDPDIDALLFHVRQFLAPGTDLFAPWVLWRLLRFGVKKTFRKMTV